MKENLNQKKEERMQHRSRANRSDHLPTTGAIKDYEDLQVFQKAYDSSIELHKVCGAFPASEQFELARQMRRSSKSVAANIAEGFGKQSFSKAEFKRYLGIAIGSADETRLWLKYARDLGFMKVEVSEQYQRTYRDIAKMLMGLYKAWE